MPYYPPPASGAKTPPVLQQVSSNARLAVLGTLAPAFAAGPASGDLILAVGSGFVGATIAPPAGFVQLASWVGTANQRIDIYAKTAGVGEGAAYNFVLTGTAPYAVQLYDVSNFGALTFNFGNAVVYGANEYGIGGQVLTSNGLVCGVVEQDGSVGWTGVATGFTSDAAVPGSSNHFATFMHGQFQPAFALVKASAQFSGALTNPTAGVVVVN